MVLTEKRKAYGLLVFLLSGLFGLITLNGVSSSTTLFPALSGLFGFSGLIVSFYGKSRLPAQRKTSGIERGKIKGCLAGWLAGMLAGLLPGIGSSQAGAVTGQVFRTKAKDFLVTLGGISSANIIFTLVAFYTIGKTRSGAVAAMAQIAPTITVDELLLLMLVALATAFLSVIITLKAAGIAIKRMQGLDYKNINLAIIIFLIIAVFIFTGPLGLLISLAGTLLGIAAIKLGVKRSHMMGFLILPTMLYFSGLSGLVSHLLGL